MFYEFAEDVLESMQHCCFLEMTLAGVRVGVARSLLVRGNGQHVNFFLVCEYGRGTLFGSVRGWGTFLDAVSACCCRTRSYIPSLNIFFTGWPPSCGAYHHDWVMFTLYLTLSLSCLLNSASVRLTGYSTAYYYLIFT